MKIQCNNKNNLGWVSWLVYAIHIIVGGVFAIGGLAVLFQFPNKIGLIAGLVVFLNAIVVIVYGAILGDLIATFGDIECNTRSSYELLEYLVNHQIKMDEHLVKMDEHMVQCGQYMCDRMADMCDIKE